MTHASIAGSTIRRFGEGRHGMPPAPHPGPPPIDPAVRDTPVLIIEDEALIAWTLESLFDDMGFTRIALAPSAREAVAAAARTRPGLIVSDINLGNGPDGVEAVATIHREGPPVPVVFVTGYADDDARARIAQALPGATVMRKPVQADDLQRAVATALAPPTAH